MRKGVQVVLLNDKGEVLAVSRKDNHSDFGLIGGKIDPEDNDNPLVAIKRETKEETGLDITNLRLIYTGEGKRTQFTYVADWCGEIHTDEPHLVKWTGFQEVIDGSFGIYNKEVARILTQLGIKFVL